jgi:drug/metabolite transporter (DMT)-like permease
VFRKIDLWVASGAGKILDAVGLPFGHLNSGESAAAYGGKSGSGVATSSNGGTVEPWHTLRLHPMSHSDGREGSLLLLPPPRKAIRHALPVVLEGVIGPLIVFYLLLVLAGFKGALIAALTWSYLALGRRLLKGERISMLLLLGTILITFRTVIAFVTGSAFIYFAQPTAGAVAASVALLVSAIIGRPFTQRFAHDFCPMDPAIMRRPLVRRFFIRISVLWATVMMLNAGLVFWLLVTSSLRSFVLERSAVTYGLTAIAVFISITGFMAMMRQDGITVQWANNRAPRFDPAP